MAKRQIEDFLDDEFFTEAELAKLFKCSKGHIQRLRYQGRGPAYIKHGRRVLFPKSMVKEYVNRNRVVHNPQPEKVPA